MSYPPVLVAAAIILLSIAKIIVLERLGGQRWLRGVAAGGLLLCAAALAFLPIRWPSTQHALLASDAFAVYVGLLCLGIALLTIMASRERSAAYLCSVLLSAIGMLLAAGATDLLLLFVSIELVTAPTYVLVAWGRTRQRMEAATKYFIVGIISSLLLLLGLLLISVAGGSTSLAALVPSSSPLFLLGIGALLAGLGFKLGIFPFNLWIPDVYQGAPPQVAGLLAGAAKKAGYAALLRVAAVIALALHSWALVIAVLAALTMTLPNLAAIWQGNARRMVAYSIMSHAGFLLMGVAAGGVIGTGAVLFHAATHAAMVLGAFLVLGVFAAHRLERIEDLSGLGRRNPFLGVALTLFLLSLAGIPLLAGFASKLALFVAAADAGLAWLTALAVLNSVIALFYYFRIIRALYAHRSAGKRFEVRAGVLVAVAACLVVTVLFGLFPGPMIEWSSAAAQALG